MMFNVTRVKRRSQPVSTLSSVMGIPLEIMMKSYIFLSNYHFTYVYKHVTKQSNFET